MIFFTTFAPSNNNPLVRLPRKRWEGRTRSVPKTKTTTIIELKFRKVISTFNTLFKKNIVNYIVNYIIE